MAIRQTTKIIYWYRHIAHTVFLIIPLWERGVDSGREPQHLGMMAVGWNTTLFQLHGITTNSHSLLWFVQYSMAVFLNLFLFQGLPWSFLGKEQASYGPSSLGLYYI